MKITIGREIAFSFFVMLILLIGMSGITYQGFKKVTANLDNMELESVKRGAAGNLRFNITQLLMPANDYILTQKQYYQREFDRINLVVDNFYHEFNRLPLTDEEQRLSVLIKQDLDSIRAYSVQIFSIPNPRQSPKAWALMETMDYRFGEAVNKKSTQIFDGISKRVEEYRRQAAAVKENAANLIFGVTFLSIFISLIVSFLTVRRISKPIVAVAKAADSIASGDYSQRVRIKTNDEVAILSNSFNTMAESIQRSQKALKESKRLTEVIVSTIPIGLFVIYASGKILSVNNAFCKSFGLDQHLLPGQNIIPLFEKLNAPEECRIHILTRKPVSDMECNYSDPVKGTRIINLTLCPIPLTEGESLLIVEDITERKHNEQIVIDSEKHFRELLENSSDGLIIISANGTLLYESPSSARTVGYAYGELLNKNIFALIHHDDFEPTMDLLAKLLEQPSTITQTEFRFQHKDGTWRWIDVTAKNSLHVAAIGGIVINFHDITERKRAEETLRESEDRYRQLFENSPIGIYRTTPDGRILAANPAITRMLGYSSFDEYANRNLEQTPDTLYSRRAFKEQLERDGFITGLEAEWYKADKTPLFVRENAQVVRDETGKVLYYDGTVEDITERKRAEKELHKIGTAIEQSADCVVITDKNGIIQYVNTAFTKITGYSKEEAIGKTPRILKSGFHPPEFYEELWKTILSGQVFREAFINKRKDGELIYDIRTITPIKDKEGHITHFVSTAKEITEQVRAEEAMRKKEEHHKAVIENIFKFIPEGVLVLTESLNLLKQNKAFDDIVQKYAPLLGYTEQELVEKITGQLRSKIVTGDSKEIHIGKNDQLETDPSGRDELIFQFNTARMFLAEEEEEEEEASIVVSLLDITAKKKMIEELIIAKEKAEEMNRLKTNFLNNMSHELRTPLNGILGYAGILTSQLDDPELNEMAQGVFQSGRRLCETLNLILDLSEAEADKIEVIAKDIAVIPLVKNSISSFVKEAAKKDLQLETIIKDENIYAHLDEHLFNRILYNLIDNALKFTKHGEITVEIGKEVSDGKDPDYSGVNWFYVKVKDTGIGIARDKIDLIWDEFRQVSEGISRSYEGPGLGLTISKRAVELMQGVISVESELGVGSTFTVKFPAVSVVPQKEELVQEESERSFGQAAVIQREKETVETAALPFVLCVEDDFVNRHIVKLFLKNICIVETAEDGETALQLAAENKYDLILMDINLGGGMNGMEAVKEIVKMPQYAGTPIIAVTAYAMGKDKAEFLKGGCTHYIAKPFLKHEFIDLVTSALKKT